MHTQVGIIGAGPAGLFLAHLLHLKGIDSVVLENRSREYVIDRVRAGVLEQFTVDLMTAMGAGERLHREGLRHDSLYLSFAGQRHHVPLAELTGGKAISYGQNEVVKDLIEARLATSRPLHFEVENVSVHNIDTSQPSIRYVANGNQEELTCDFIAGCDGFHGIPRPAIGKPSAVTTRSIRSAGWAFSRKPRRLPRLWSTRITSAALLCSACAPRRSRGYIFRCRRTRISINGPMTQFGRRC